MYINNPVSFKNNKFSVGHNLTIFLLLIILIVNSFYLGYRYYDSFTLNNNSTNNETKKIAIIKDMLKDYYLFSDKVPNEQIIDGAINGMISSVGDPYTRYVSNKDYEEFQIQTTGSFGGIGATLSSSDKNDGVIIKETQKGLGADISGLKQNDKIISVDGKKLKGMGIEEAIELIRGKVGTDVTLLVEREDSKEPIKVIIQRQQVDLPLVSYKMLDNKIGYIQYMQFSTSSIKQFDKAYNDLKKQNLKSLILDLRSNPGGLVNISIDMASRFLEKDKTVVTIKGKKYKLEQKIKETPYTINVPIVVLVDENSASSSEILTGALKDYKKAVIIGKTTYGKGLIQETIPFNDKSAMIVTTSQYVTPNGNDIQGKGIKPDIEISLDENDISNGIDTQLEKAINYIKTL